MWRFLTADWVVVVLLYLMSYVVLHLGGVGVWLSGFTFAYATYEAGHAWRQQKGGKL